MKDNITQPQAAFNLPQYGLVSDWSFIKGREQYAAFVRDWKAAYKYLSVETRAIKLMYRIDQSNRAKPNNDKVRQLTTQLMTQVRPAQFRNNYVADTILIMWNNNPNNGRRIFAQWLLSIRAQAKVKAQEFYNEDHNPEFKRT